MSRLCFLLALSAMIAIPLATPPKVEAARRTSGEIVVQVYHQPRRGRRIKIRNAEVVLSNGMRARTNKYGVARFRNVRFGRYRATACGVTTGGALRRSVLRLQIVVPMGGGD